MNLKVVSNVLKSGVSSLEILKVGTSPMDAGRVNENDWILEILKGQR